jgi:hypothetical protein
MLLDDKDRDLGPELSRGQHVPPHAQLRELAPIGEAARERRRPFQVITLTDAVPSASSTVRRPFQVIALTDAVPSASSTVFSM